MKIVYTSRLHTMASAAWGSTVRPAHILIRPPLREYWLARFTIQFKSSTHMIHLGGTRPGGARVMKPIRFGRTVRIPFGARCRTHTTMHQIIVALLFGRIMNINTTFPNFWLLHLTIPFPETRGINWWETCTGRARLDV
jgi:hypothetical protein